MTRKAIRVYEERGLLAPLERTAAGYRRFGAADVNTLRFIRRARSIGLRLDDVAEVVARRHGGVPCSTVRAQLADCLAEIEHTISELTALRARLANAAERCPTAPAAGTTCPIIDSTSGSE